MYTIIMDKYKQLIKTVETKLYQKEKLTEKLQFLFPVTYNDIDLSNFIIILKYVDQQGIPHAEVLSPDDDLYKDKIRCTMPIDSNLTEFSGDISIRITFEKIDMENQTQYVLHTGETIISISPLKDYYSFVPDKSLEFVDQLVGNLEAKIEATEKIADTYDKSKADNISYSDNILQLTSNGTKIGNAITLSGESITAENFNVVEF